MMVELHTMFFTWIEVVRARSVYFQSGTALFTKVDCLVRFRHTDQDCRGSCFIVFNLLFWGNTEDALNQSLIYY